MATSVPENPPPTIITRKGSVESDKLGFAEGTGRRAAVQESNPLSTLTGSGEIEVYIAL